MRVLRRWGCFALTSLWVLGVEASPLGTQTSTLTEEVLLSAEDEELILYLDLLENYSVIEALEIFRLLPFLEEEEND